MRYAVQKLAKGSSVPMTVVRAGQTLKLTLPLQPGRPLLIPDLKGDYPPYFVYGPVVFSKATVQFSSFMNNNPGAMAALGFVRSPLITARRDAPTPEREELQRPSRPAAQVTMARNQSGRVADFWVEKSTQIVVAPPAA